MIFPGFLSRTLFVLFFSCLFVVSTFAAGSIPRTDLRLELMLATGSQDTSGNNRVVTATGIAPTYQIDPTYGVPFAQFGGSGGLSVNTSWVSATDNFTISLWMKHNGVFLTGATSLTGQTLKYRVNAQNGSTDTTYATHLSQDIFTTGQNHDIKLILDASGKCSFHGLSGQATISDNSFQEWSPALGTSIWVTNMIYETLDFGSNMKESFNCNSLLDNKWHNVVLMKQNTYLIVYVDGIESARFTTTVSIGRNVLIGNGVTDTNTYTGKFLSGQLNLIRDSKYLRGNISGFRIYSRSLSNDELESIFDEFRYGQSDLAGAGGIQITMDKYAKPNLYVFAKNISLALSKNDVTYEYSTDGISYAAITDITDISTSTGSISYRMGIDLTGKPDGKINLTYRIRATNNTFQSVGTISFIKMDIATGITINMPNSDQSNSKTITAEAPGSELKMFITTGIVCDSTIGTGSFEDYSDLTFTNKSDNTKRICYKATYNTINKVVFRLSAPISGIQSGDTITSSNIFDEYLLWTKSSKPKLNDSAFFVLGMLGYNTTNVTGTAANGITMTDINGDGLVDFLYSKNDLPRRAIIVNNGNYTFKTVYKCAIDPAGNNYSAGSNFFFNTTTYYGDCADTTR